MIRNALPALLVLCLAGCGFHLREKLALPEDAPPVRVVSNSPFSELVTILERNLRNAGATVVVHDRRAAGEAAAGGEDAGEVREARLEILSERWGDLPIAIDQRGRAQEFSLRYATIFTFRQADGRELVPQQVVELSRDYVSPPVNATGTSTEREILADELRREMAASILRRIDSVVRAELAREAAARASSPDSTVPLDPPAAEESPAPEGLPVPAEPPASAPPSP